MTNLRPALDQDADEAVRRARELPEAAVPDSVLDLLVVLQDREQSTVRRVRSAFALNAVGSSHALPQSLLVPTLGALAALVREPDHEVRRNALVAISSLLHSAAAHMSPTLSRFADGLQTWSDQFPQRWERRVLANAQAAMSACARVKPDSALAKIVGLGPMPKHRVLSKVELYIDMKRLEDSVNQAFIVPNGPLARVFGSKRRVRRDAVPKLLEQHVS